MVFYPAGLGAQHDLSTHFMSGVYQAMWSNPATVPDHRVVISLPGVYNHFWNSGFSWSDAIREDPGGQRTLDIDRLIDGLESKNFIKERLDIQTFGLAVQAGNWTFSAGHQARFHAYAYYPKELAQLIWKGNAQFIGQTVSIGPELFTRGYQEFHLGLAVRPRESFRLGARVKLLSGIGDASTSRSDLALSTSDDIYQLTLSSDFQFNATAPLQYNGLDDFTVDVDAADFPFDQLFSKNNGIALDLGAEFFLDRLTLRASVLDLGRITWKQDATNLSLTGDFEFKGLDVFRQLLDDTSNIAGGVIDSLEAIYDIRQSFVQYRTALPMQTFLSATLALNDSWDLHALAYGERLGSRFFPAFAAGAQMRVGRFMQWGLSYVARYYQYDQMGANVSIRLGPIQAVASTDHLPGLVGWKKAHQANLRLGLNLVFGLSEAAQSRGPKRLFIDERKFF
ncbi:MAG: hypothetical protein IPN74_05875 [Haliscomenobacter sp.]|nr:hypothetical protein [Haliscomenobacter sp.]